MVVSDTTRIDFLGPYGNKHVKTPTLDQLAKESTFFERAHPECLPTIPTRRTLHSGRHAFPFRNYKPIPWDNVVQPGWQPMSSDEDVVAEALARSGYQTGFVSDVPHYTVPGNNFTRGFEQWDYVRGTSEDRYRSTATVDMKKLKERYGIGLPRAAQHVANLGGFDADEMAYPTPRTFTSAMKFLEENKTNTKPFYLYVDTFHPHEAWEAPRKYYNLYRDPKYKGKTYVVLPYGTGFMTPIADETLADVRAHYSGLITMMDHWFGQLLAKLKELGKDRDTLVIYLSDHGTNFADNIEKVMGKPSGAMYPGTMNVPLLVPHPQGHAAGKASVNTSTRSMSRPPSAPRPERRRAKASKGKTCSPSWKAARSRNASIRPAATATASGTPTTRTGTSRTSTATTPGCSTWKRTSPSRRRSPRRRRSDQARLAAHPGRRGRQAADLSTQGCRQGRGRRLFDVQPRAPRAFLQRARETRG